GGRRGAEPNVSTKLSLPPPCDGDFNRDGAVGTPDLVFFLGRFGETVTPGTDAGRADFSGNGVVDTPDLVVFLGRFGQVCL
ncbi:MAG: hypothetical protein J0L61_03670, partial [Planctomycetes bacterium]|nr:hypothetical protein [Planctomycetota bacterium]